MFGMCVQESAEITPLVFHTWKRGEMRKDAVYRGPAIKEDVLYGENL